MPCVLEISGYGFLKGRTREVSEQEVSVLCANLAFPGIKKPKVGASCVLTFELVLYGTPKEILRMPCRINYVNSIDVGVHIHTQALNPHQQRCYFDLLKSED